MTRFHLNGRPVEFGDDGGMPLLSALEKDLRGLELAPIEIWDVNGRPVG